jgi:dipeptidase E
MQLLLISSSNVYGYGYLDHAEPEIKSFLGSRKKVAFVPFALRDHEGYTAKVRERLRAMGFDVSQVRSESDLDAADAIFVGGGNTWRLLHTLYERRMLDPIRNRVRKGMPYIGSSAGTNIVAPTIKTTNDMPIIQPPSFDALGLVSFQINPHYLDPDPSSKHKGETREERIREFLEENTTPVVGLREGTMLRVTDGETLLVGLNPARIFRRGGEPVEAPPGERIDQFLK